MGASQSDDRLIQHHEVWLSFPVLFWLNIHSYQGTNGKFMVEKLATESAINCWPGLTRIVKTAYCLYWKTAFNL